MSAVSTQKTTFASLIDDGILDITDGYRAKNSELGGSGPIFLRAGHVTDSHIDFAGVERFHEHLRPRLAEKLSHPGDVIVTTKGNSTGRTSYVTPDLPQFVYSPHLSRWRSLDSERLEPGFLRYWSRSREFVDQLRGMMVSTDMAPYLSLRDQRRLAISLLPIKHQRAIAHILGALDDKIELNRRMNRTLEALARAVFRAWFEELGSTRTEVSELSKAGVLEVGDGYRAKNSELDEAGLPFLRAGNLNGGFDVDSADRLGFASVAKAGAKLSRPGDVAFTSKGTIGRMARVDATTPQFVYAPQVCFWRSLDRERLHPSILYCWMTSDDFRGQVRARSGQTDMAPYISLRDQRAMTLPLFPPSQREVGDRIEVLLRRQASAVGESRALAAIRDALLPKLISGEVRVDDRRDEPPDRAGDLP